MATQPISTGGVATNVGSGEFTLDNLIPAILGKFVDVMFAVLILVIAYFLSRYIRSRIRKVEVTHEHQRNALNLFEKITNGFVIVISTTLALKVVGIDMTLLVSVSVLGLSYGLQDIIKNYVAGILILFKAPFKIGDVIKIRDYTGRVDKMDFQSTTLQTFDHRYVTIYNSDVMTQSIINFSTGKMRRIEIDVQLGYGSDTASAFKTFEKILAGNVQILKNPPFRIVFKKFDDHGIVFTLKGWVQMPANLLAVKTALANQIHLAFNESNIYMPYSKGIETNDDYTLASGRNAVSQTLINIPEFAASNDPAIALIDSEEPE